MRRLNELGDAAQRDETAPSYFRTVRHLPSAPISARLYITARGLYTIYFNGQRVGQRVLAPGWTDYRQWIDYDVYDVTEVLHAGSNVLTAMVGDGWYAGYIGFLGQRQHYGTDPELLLELRIHCADGQSFTIVSDGSWRARTGPVRSSDLLMGEVYEASHHLGLWMRPDYDDALWPLSQAGGRAAEETARLRGTADDGIAVSSRPPVRIQRMDADRWLIDFGQNLVGWVHLPLPLDQRQPLIIRYGEWLQADGQLYQSNLRAARATDEYHPSLDGYREAFYEPLFTMHGFRYVEIHGWDSACAPSSIMARVVRRDTAQTSTFVTDHPLLQRLYQNITWS
ncbi:MAG: family 78 glycoside hydrolase catalytic domain, partial [Firmicutes bacterium]|nr:family 78 glycoside hydrolase catalytic domain [Bacillota bacterium]